jgi:O-antigen ligase
VLAREAIGRMGVPALTVGMGIAFGAYLSQPAAQRPAMAAVLAMLAVVGYTMAPEVAILSLVVLRPVVDAYVYISVAGLSLGVLWAGLVTVFCAVYLLTHSSGLRRISQRLAAPLLFLALFAALTLARPGWTSAAVIALKVGAWLILAVTVAAIASRSQGRAAVLRYMSYAAVVTAATMLIAIVQDRFGAAYYGFASASGENAGPHALASLAVAVLPFVLWGILANRRAATSIITTLALSLGIFLSYVRSAYLGFAAIMLVFAVVALRGTRLRTKMSGVGFLAFVATLGYYAQDAIVPRLMDLVGRGSQSVSPSAGSGRTEIWSAVLHQSLATPLRVILGNGAEASTRYIVDAGLPPLGAHNDPLAVLASGGVVLLCGYLALLWWMARPAISVARMRTADGPTRCFGLLAIAAVVAYLVMSLTNGMVFAQSSAYMGVLVGVCYGFLAEGGTELTASRDNRARSSQVRHGM